MSIRPAASLARRLCTVCSNAAGASEVGRHYSRAQQVGARSLSTSRRPGVEGRPRTSHGVDEPLSEQGQANPKRHRYRRGYIPLSFLVVPPILYWVYTTVQGEEPLSPYSYTDHSVSTTRKLTAKHVEVAVPLHARSKELFSHPELVAPGPSRPRDRSMSQGAESGVITVHHLMVKNPDLMIERPYTPVNDVEADGEARLVVKRVRGGEVGRMIHGLQSGSTIGLRGPLPTFSLNPSEYDRIVMISSGTGAAPFMQFLSKLSPGGTIESPRLHLIHALPHANASTVAESDWIQDPTLLPALQAKHEANLQVSRMTHGSLQRDVVASAVQRKAGERIMVLACLPPNLMRELCGNLTATLDQGEVTGLLRELGLTKSDVWKLE